jgi:hypothetical protein
MKMYRSLGYIHYDTFLISYLDRCNLRRRARRSERYQFWGTCQGTSSFRTHHKETEIPGFIERAGRESCFTAEARQARAQWRVPSEAEEDHYRSSKNL